MDALLPHRPHDATHPGGYCPRLWTTAVISTIGLAGLALLGCLGTYHVVTDRLPASSSPSAPSSSSWLPPADVSAPVQTAPKAPRATPPVGEANLLLSTRAPAVPPLRSVAVDAVAADTPRHPHYPLLGPVRKVVSEVSSPVAPDAYADRRGVRCIMSDTYRFIYIGMHKSGSSSVRGYLVDSLCGSVEERDKTGSNCTSPLLNYRDTAYNYVKCTEVPPLKFASYYVFSHVRNAWARAVSSYSYCRSHATHYISWAAWCADPDIDRGCYPVPAATSVVEHGALPSTRRGVNQHWAAQLPRLCVSPGECRVDYVGRTEELGAHLNTVIDAINAINARREPGLAPLPPYIDSMENSRLEAAPPAAWYLPRSALSAVDAAAADAEGVTPEPSCRAAIARYFAADVEAFGFTFEEIAGRNEVAELRASAGASRL